MAVLTPLPGAQILHEERVFCRAAPLGTPEPSLLISIWRLLYTFLGALVSTPLTLDLSLKKLSYLVEWSFIFITLSRWSAIEWYKSFLHDPIRCSAKAFRISVSIQDILAAPSSNQRLRSAKVKALLLQRCALRKFHVTDGQNTRDQITSDRRSKRA